jgi:hypothetical protein
LAEADATLPGLMESAFYFVESSPAAMLAGRAPELPPRLERRRRGLLGGLRSRRF